MGEGSWVNNDWSKQYWILLPWFSCCAFAVVWARGVFGQGLVYAENGAVRGRTGMGQDNLECWLYEGSEPGSPQNLPWLFLAPLATQL